MIGGTGDKKTLRLVAKYADASNMFALGVDVLAAKLDTLAGGLGSHREDRVSAFSFKKLIAQTRDAGRSCRRHGIGLEGPIARAQA
jgi:predicted TIM-barrel enzyme